MRTMQFNTSLGNAFVWGLTNGVDGFHFLMPSDDEFKHYYSQRGRIFSRAYQACNWNLLLGPEEGEEEKVTVMRGLWEKFINAEFARQNPT